MFVGGSADPSNFTKLGTKAADLAQNPMMQMGVPMMTNLMGVNPNMQAMAYGGYKKQFGNGGSDDPKDYYDYAAKRLGFQEGYRPAKLQSAEALKLQADAAAAYEKVQKEEFDKNKFTIINQGRDTIPANTIAPDSIAVTFPAGSEPEYEWSKKHYAKLQDLQDKYNKGGRKALNDDEWEMYQANSYKTTKDGEATRCLSGDSQYPCGATFTAYSKTAGMMDKIIPGTASIASYMNQPDSGWASLEIGEQPRFGIDPTGASVNWTASHIVRGGEPAYDDEGNLIGFQQAYDATAARNIDLETGKKGAPSRQLRESGDPAYFHDRIFFPGEVKSGKTPTGELSYSPGSRHIYSQAPNREDLQIHAYIGEQAKETYNELNTWADKNPEDYKRFEEKFMKEFITDMAIDIAPKAVPLTNKPDNKALLAEYYNMYPIKETNRKRR
jgi:hypothetical protein